MLEQLLESYPDTLLFKVNGYLYLGEEHRGEWCAVRIDSSDAFDLDEQSQKASYGLYDAAYGKTPIEAMRNHISLREKQRGTSS